MKNNMVYMDKGEKNRLIAFSQYILESLHSEVGRLFKTRAPLPAYDEDLVGEYLRYDMSITFSLLKLQQTEQDLIMMGRGVDIVNQIAQVFINEITLDLYRKLHAVLDLKEEVLIAKSPDSIINFTQYHQNGSLICNEEDIMFFESHPEWIEGSMKEYVGINEPYIHGFIGECAVYVDPASRFGDQLIYYIKRPLIHYGIRSDQEFEAEYLLKDDDIDVTYTGADIYYKLSTDIDSITKFKISVDY